MLRTTWCSMFYGSCYGPHGVCVGELNPMWLHAGAKMGMRAVAAQG